MQKAARFSASRSISHGFTLIELMIVVAIVAILTTIALPSYRDYVLRGRLVDGQNGLASMRADMERFFQDNRTYATTGSFTSPCLVDATKRMAGSFQLSCSAGPTATSFTLMALGGGTTAGFTYTLDNLNNRATPAVGPGWTVCANDWVTRKGQTC